MKIIVNARFLTQKMTGVQRFATELAVRLAEEKCLDIEFVTPKNIVHLNLARKLNAKIIGSFSGHLWEQICLPFYLRVNKKPLLINLCSTAPIIYKNQIITHHDITYIRFPQSFSSKFILLYKLIIPLILRSSKKVITVSNFSKKRNFFTLSYSRE